MAIEELREDAERWGLPISAKADRPMARRAIILAAKDFARRPGEVTAKRLENTADALSDILSSRTVSKDVRGAKRALNRLDRPIR